VPAGHRPSADRRVGAGGEQVDPVADRVGGEQPARRVDRQAAACLHQLELAVVGWRQAIEVDGQVIRVYDSHDHITVPHSKDDFDRRWLKIRPPLVVVGGELTIQSLELMGTETPRFYEAPFQLKANGGVLVVDDLGRQRCTAKELLNRWIVPLENRIDFLTLNTGKKIQVPLEQIVIFATNLTTADISDSTGAQCR